MRLFYIWSEGIEELHILFRANHNAQEAFIISDTKISQPEGESVFKSEVWYDAVLQKIRRDYKVLVDSPGETVVFCDPDVCIYDAHKLRKYLETRMQKEELEFLAMQEAGLDMHNGGFICVKSTEDTRNLYLKSLNALEYFVKTRRKPLLKLRCWLKFGLTDLPYLDQSIMNLYLKKGIAKYAYIPGSIGCWGDKDVSEETLFHHAVCTITVDEKVKLLNKKKNERNKYK